MYCPTCGQETSENAKFCKKCGSPLPRAAVPTPQPTFTQKNTVTTPGSVQGSFSGDALSAVKSLSIPAIGYLIGAILVILVALIAPWYELSGLASFGASFAGIGNSMNLFSEMSALTQLQSLAGDGANLIGGVVMIGLLIVGMIASIVFLALCIYGIFRRKPSAQRNALIGFGIMAGVALVHNVGMMILSNQPAYGASMNLGSPTIFAWLILIACLLAVGCLIYMNKQKTPIF